jgi:hypothetical protein
MLRCHAGELHVVVMAGFDRRVAVLLGGDELHPLRCRRRAGEMIELKRIVPGIRGREVRS